MERSVMHIAYRCNETKSRESFKLFTAANNPNKVKKAIEAAIHAKEMFYGDPNHSITRQIKDLRRDWNLCDTADKRISMLNRNLICGKYEVMYEGEVL